MGENVVAHNEKLEFAFTYRPGVNDLYLPLNTRVGVNILINCLHARAFMQRDMTIISICT